MLMLHFTRIGGSTQTEEVPVAKDVSRKLDTGQTTNREGAHPRGDEKYAQSSEGPGDTAVTWRRRRALLASRTGTLVIPNREFVGIPSPRFFISVHSGGS